MFSKKDYLFLFLILTIATYLRFYNLLERGILFWDEGCYLLEAESYFEKPFLGIRYTLAKPGHSLLIAIFFLIFGLKDYVGCITSAFFGILSVFLIFLLGNILYNKKFGFISSFLLAISPFHIIYSRSSLPEITSSFFYLLALYFYILNIKRKGIIFLIFSALFFGFSYTANFRLIFIFPLILIYEIFFFKGRIFKIAKRYILFIIIFFLPLFLFQLPNYIVQKIRLDAFPHNYLDTLLLFIKANIAPLNSLLFLKNIKFYLEIFFEFEGILLIFLITGLFYIFKKFNDSELILITSFFIPFFLYSYNSISVPRAVSVTIPFFILISCVGILNLSQKWKNFSFHFLFTILTITFLTFLNNYSWILNLKSGYREAIYFLHKKKIYNYFSTMTPISAAYTRADIVLTPWGVSIYRETGSIIAYPPPTVKELEFFYKRYGMRYCLVDWQKFIQYYPSIKFIEKNCKKIYQVENSYVVNRYILLENSLGDVKNFTRDFYRITIYDLKTCLK